MDISRLYSFINNTHGFSVNFLAGKSLMNQIHEVHNIGPNAKDFYQKVVLSSELMIHFLKPGENLGVYIDSEEPFFRFKVEMAQNGHMRTLLLPEEFDELPKVFTGKVRINKVTPNSAPYTSVIESKEEPLDNLINQIIDKSYQTNSQAMVLNDTTSVLINKLPPTNINKKIEDFEELSLDQFIEKISTLLETASNLNQTDVQAVVELFEKHELKYLGSKEVRFSCPCSKERMESHLRSLSNEDKEDLFKETEQVDTRCDYCNTIYTFSKNEIFTKLQ